MMKEPGSLVEYIAGLKSHGATNKDIRKSFRRVIENKAREQLIPLHGTFELTPFCNLDCKMCYVHLNNEQLSKDHLIPVETWKALIDDAHDAGMMQATLTGGECLTYPGFDELYLYLLSKGIVPVVATNGLLLDEDRMAFFKRYPPSMIQVTLYGSSDDTYEKVTGHRVFQTVYRNLESLREAKLKAYVALTPSAYMREDLRSLVETARSLGLPFGINASLVTPREETGRQLKDLETDQYLEIYRILKELEQEELHPIDPVELPDENRQGKAAYGLQCGGGRSSFAIQYNGKMSPCPSLGEVTTEPLREGFLSAWHRLNDLVSHYPIPEECGECAYHDYCLNCAAIHNNAHNPGHCDPRVCERTKRLIREGFMKLRKE